MLDMAPKEKHRITHNLYEQLVGHADLHADWHLVPAVNKEYLR
jgi:hypothetical protein